MDLFELKNVDLSQGGKSILMKISFSVSEGERLNLVGPSGSGKSSILKLLAGLHSVSQGQILYRGRDLSTLDMPSYRQEVSYCFQQPVLFGMTVEDNLRFPYVIRQKEFDEMKAISALESVKLSKSFLSKKITELSGGEKQRVALIRNLLFEPKVLLLDEVTAGLDTDTKDTVHQLLNRYHAGGKTLIEVTHDPSELEVAQRIVKIEGGQVKR